MKEEAVAGMKSEVGDVAEVEEAGEAVEAGEAGEAVERPGTQPSPDLPSPPPPPPLGGEQMEVDDSLWEKQVVGRGDAGDKNDKNENAPLDANGVDTNPTVHEQAGT